MDIYQYCINNDVKWVFFDCFDTLIHRKKEFHYVCCEWAEKVIRDCRLNISVTYLCEIRQEIIDMFFKKEYLHYNYTEIMEELYKRLIYGEYFIERMDFNKFEIIALQIEISLEKKNITIDTFNVNLLQNLAEKNMKIGIISDFYMGGDFLKEILSETKILSLVDSIHVSCDYKKRKSDGMLYAAVMNELGVVKNKCVMIGDNFYSDVKMARKNGIKPFLYRYEECSIKNLEYKLYKEFENNEHNKIKLINYSYSVYIFLSKLYSKLVETGKTEVFFLAREGEFLKEAFDLIQKKQMKKITTFYLYVSRKATLLPSLSEIDKEDFNRIFRQTKELSLETFLDILQIDEVDQRKIYSRFCDVDKKAVKDFTKSDIISRLKNDVVFQTIYENRRTKEKKAFISYIETYTKKFYNDELVVVDVGWKGTIQDNLYQIFDEKVKIQGYYIGLTSLGNIAFDNRKEGLLFAMAPTKSKGYSTWLSREAYERIMRASHGLTTGYELSGNIGTPIFEKNNLEFDAYKYIRPTQLAILNSLERLDEIVQFSSYQISDLEDIFIKLHRKFILGASLRTIRFDKNLFWLNKESFVPLNLEKQRFISRCSKNIKLAKRLLKGIVDIKIYNQNGFWIYRLPPSFTWIWSRLIYAKQVVKGEIQ